MRFMIFFCLAFLLTNCADGSGQISPSSEENQAIAWIQATADVPGGTAWVDSVRLIATSETGEERILVSNPSFDLHHGTVYEDFYPWYGGRYNIKESVVLDCPDDSRCGLGWWSLDREDYDTPPASAKTTINTAGWASELWNEYFTVSEGDQLRIEAMVKADKQARIRIGIDILVNSQISRAFESEWQGETANWTKLVLR